MEFNWHYQAESPTSIKSYLKQLDIPRAFTSWVKFSGGIQLNHQAVTVRKTIQAGDLLTLITPDELGYETVVPAPEGVEVVYEDRDVLVVNKPVGIVSIPSIKNPSSSMANRIRGYYMQQNYADQVIHIVTRLDRDTSGLMLIAKHRLAHALLDRQIQAQQINKIYYAISSRADWLTHGLISAPIARDEDSIITRRVHESGKVAMTEYWLEEALKQSSLLRLQLHTGRTHQIRVHMQHLGGPLIGDDLYGGPLVAPLMRQALHCGELSFSQPFTTEPIVVKQSLPSDMQEWIILNRQ